MTGRDQRWQHSSRCPNIFYALAALAEFERELIAERTTAGLASARARGRNGGRPYK
ncbi:recombinase family protein, partial [Klebsiella aerogenes]|uniref:recombinase family protein n=2 Tax=Gammaproteobacteria TaxID=1236 RepID=UPI00358DAC7B